MQKLKLELSKYYDLDRDKETFIRVFFLLLRKILNKTVLSKINKRYGKT